MAHIALTSYDLETGGISRVATYLANSFSEAGHEVSLLLCCSKGNLDTELRSKLNPTINIVDFDWFKFPSRALGQILTLPAYRKWLKINRPDILMSTSNNISWFTGLGLVLLGGGIPKLYIKTTNPIIRANDGPRLTAFRRWGYAKLFDQADAVLTLSDAETRVLENEFPGQANAFQAVFNPYLTRDFHTGAARPEKREDTESGPIFFTAGRLENQKNVKRMIQAFALARQKDRRAEGYLKNARMLIAGEGSQLAALEQLTDTLHEKQAIEFLGFRTDVPELMKEADMFVLSSNYEGLPAVAIEALGSNLPVVTTDCFPAARELLDGLPGCAVTDLNADSLADGILYGAKHLNPNANLRDRATNYSVESAAASHLDAMDL